jgi:hypothetical protein
MLYEAQGITRFIVICGYTDYPRRIIIREDFTQHSCFSVLNNSSQITIVHLSLLYKLQ